MSKNLTGLLLAMGCVLQSSLSNYALAQMNNMSGSSTNNKGKEAVKRCPMKLITKEVHIPEVPRYPGAQFVSGREFDPGDDNHIEKAYTVNYRVNKGNEDQIITWYANELSSSGWKIEQQTRNAVHVQKGITHHCDVFCDGVNKGACMLHINYAELARATDTSGNR